MSTQEEPYNGPAILREKTEGEKKLWNHNMMQIELALRRAKDLVNKDQKIEDWSGRYSAGFSKIFQREEKADPELLKKLEDVSFREDFIKRIEAELYKDDKGLFINRNNELEDLREAA